MRQPGTLINPKLFAGQLPPVLALLFSYLTWGLYPLLWAYAGQAQITALEILTYRIVLACAALSVFFLFFQRRWPPIPRRAYVLCFFSASCMGCNWLLGMWAAQHGYVLQSSFGYFIAPLLNVSLGVLMMRERLRRGQWLAVSLAGGAVAQAAFGQPLASGLWITGIIALTSSGYTLLRKRVQLAPLAGLWLETVYLLPIPLAVALYDGLPASPALRLSQPAAVLALSLAAALTVATLAAFAFGASRLPLSQLGFLQYSHPISQMLLALFYFKESFSPAWQRMLLLVLVALGIFSVSAWRHRRARRR